MTRSIATEGVLHGWFLRSLRRNPAAVALRVAGESYTYQQIHDHALALAGEVVARVGDRPRRVGLLASRTELAYAGILAAGYAGASVVPLNPDFPAERTRDMITAAEIDALLVDDNGRPLLGDLGSALDGTPVISELSAPPLEHPHSADPDDIAYILFTSGSTGRPKGVPVRHRNVEFYLRFVHDRYGFGPSDVFSQTGELTFDLAMFDIFSAWGSGGTLVCMPPQAFMAVPQFVRKYGITVWCSSPSVISLLRRMGKLTPGCMPSMRLAVFCGEPLLRDDAADWQAATGGLVENLYGPTELTISCSVHTWDPVTSPALCVNDIVLIGTMHPGLDYVLVDSEGVVGAESGELCVTGPQMFPGYLDPRDDEGRFLEHDGRRWYRTGDIARLEPNGELAFLGRRDHQVKIHGVRVELSEVESGLRRLRGVTDAVAIALDGELFAFYLGEERPAADLMEEMGTFYPRYLIPLHYQHLAEFPLNSNRKVDRPVLTAQINSGRIGSGS
jgi:amino acid adenylation domain-containing protein